MAHADLILLRVEHRFDPEPGAQGGRLSPPAFARLLASACAWARRPSACVLHLDTMPAHLKRDIGLLDGRGPRYDEDQPTYS